MLTQSIYVIKIVLCGFEPIPSLQPFSKEVEGRFRKIEVLLMRKQELKTDYWGVPIAGHEKTYS
jgi:hypothetical protein